MRTGIGYDIHRLVKDRRLVLAGVEIAYELGLEGHSDADVVIHAVCDALLGASGKGDIGQHFPDTDAAYKDMDSMKILRSVKEIIAKDINNIDVTIICQKPKLLPFISEMRSNIAVALDLSEEDVNVKATTNEMLGPVGESKAIAALAVATTIPGLKNAN